MTYEAAFSISGLGMSQTIMRCPHIREDGDYPIKGWQDCECGECAVLDFDDLPPAFNVFRPAVRLTKQNDTWRVSVWLFGLQHAELSPDTTLPIATAKELALSYVESFLVALLEAYERAREHV